MRFQLRGYQADARDRAVAFLRAANPGDRRVYASPTGTGKSVIELAVQAEVEDAWIVTPRLEIIAGLLDKLGKDVNDLSQDELLKHAAAARITTPIRLRSTLLAGTQAPPRFLILDEGHHDLARTWQDLHLLCGFIPTVAYTATPFRGTPAGTLDFRKVWGEPEWVIRFAAAASQGFLAMPDCQMLPLVDDDLVEVQGGELVASQVTRATKSRLADLADHCRRYKLPDHANGGVWDRATMFACPSTEVCHLLVNELQRAGLAAAVVLGDTPHAERQAIFRAAEDAALAVVQVYVVSEGVDLKLRRLIDLAPTLSPVKWQQQFGRITRPVGPGEDVPEYVCTNRNLLRHGYLLDGCLPLATIKAAQEAFPGGAGKRAATRALGLEALSRFKGCELPLASGITATFYSLSTLEGHTRTDYAVIVHPQHERVVWATSQHVKVGDQYSWGRWRRCEPPNDVTGFSSTPPREMSEKQAAWWKRSAAHRGLDADAKVTRKVFAALPVLCDLGVKL